MNLSIEEFNNLSITEFNEFIDAWQKKEERIDTRNAMLCTIIANANRGKGKAFKLDDFRIINTTTKNKKQTTDEMLAIVEQLNLMYKGEDNRVN